MVEKISEAALNRLALHGGKVTRTRKKAEPPPPPPPKPAAPPPQPTAAPDNPIPFASMAASMGTINQQLGQIVEQNTRVIESFRTEAQQKVQERPERKPWRAKVVRDRSTKLIEYVDLIPMEMSRR